MPSKAEFYRQMTEQVSTRLVGSLEGMDGLSHYCRPAL